jgi:hypothetical protein
MTKRALLLVLLGILVVLSFMGSSSPPSSHYYSVQERRMPCGRIIRREVVQENDAVWHKTVTLMDPEGRVLATKTRTIDPEHCAHIQSGKFVKGLWADCTVA